MAERFGHLLAAVSTELSTAAQPYGKKKTRLWCVLRHRIEVICDDGGNRVCQQPQVGAVELKYCS